MKQSRSAITFLMAQYRAIFKNAYLKGLVSAAVLTAGLSAGATANAAVNNGFNAEKLANSSEAEIKIEATAESGNSTTFDSLDINLSGDVSAASTITSIDVNGQVAEGVLAIYGSGSLDSSNVAWTITDKDNTLLISNSEDNDGSTAKDNVLSFKAKSLKVNSAATENATVMILAQKETNAGSTTVNLGSLIVGEEDGSGAVTISGSEAIASLIVDPTGTISLADSGSIILKGDAAANAVLSGELSETSSGIIKVSPSSSGTLSVYTATGKTSNVNIDISGTAVIDLADQPSDTLAIGASGTLNISGNLTVASGSKLDLSAIEFSSDEVATQDDSEVVIEQGAELITNTGVLDAILSGAGTALDLSLAGTVTLVSGSDLADLSGGSITGDGQVTAESLTISDSVVADLTDVKVTTPILSLESGSIGSVSPIVTQTLKVGTDTDDALSGAITLATPTNGSGSITTEDDKTLTLSEDSTLNLSGTWTAEAGIKVSGSAGAEFTLSGTGNALNVKKSFEVGSGTVSVTKSGSLSIQNGASLTIDGTGASATAANFKVDGGTVNFATGSDLSVTSGSFTVTNSTVSLKGVTIDGADTGSIVASGSSGVIEFDSLGSNVVWKATDGGTLKTSTLSGTVVETLSGVSIADGSSTLEVDTLKFTDSGEVTSTGINGVLQINSKLDATGALTFSTGTIQLGDETTAKSGSITQDLTLGGATANVYGSWTVASGKELSLTGGSLTVGDSSITSSLTADKIADVSDAGTITVNTNATMTVNGVKTQSTDLEGDAYAEEGGNGYYGFSLSGTTVDVAGGTFVIGSTAASGMIANENWTIPAPDAEEDPDDPGFIYDNFGIYKLTGNGTLQIDFASGESITSEQYLQLKKELIANIEENGSLLEGSINIGKAEVTGLTSGTGSIVTEVSGSYVVDFNDYESYKDALAGLKNETIMQSQMTGVSGSATLTSVNFGSVQLEDGAEVTFEGDSSLNNADKSGNLISYVDGTVGGATVASGSSLTLGNNGAVSEIVLVSGSSAEKQTVLNINASNTITSIEAKDGNGEPLANTKVVIGAETGSATVEEDIIISTLENNNSLKVAGNVTTDTFNNNGSSTIEGAVTTDSFTNSGSSTVYGVITADKFANNGTVDAKDTLTITTEFKDSAEAVTTGNIVEISGKSTIAGTVKATEQLTITVTTAPTSEKDYSQVAGTVDVSKGELQMSYTNVAEGGQVIADEAQLTQDVNVLGYFEAKSTTIGFVDPDGTTETSGEFTIQGTASLGDVSFAQKADGTSSSSLKIMNGNAVAKSLTGASGAVIEIGSDNVDSLASGTLEITGELSLAGATIAVDPSYDEKSALLAVKTLSDFKQDVDVGIFDGNVFVGQNSAMGVGVSRSELESVIAQYQVDGAFVDPTDENGKYGAVLYLDRPVRIDFQYGITLTSKAPKQFEKELGTATGAGEVMDGVNVYNDPGVADTFKYAAAGTIYFGQGSALGVNTDNIKDGAYITFVDNKDPDAPTNYAGTLVANGGEIVLFGDNYKKSYQLFNEEVVIKDLAGTELTSEGIQVVSANGLLEGILSGDSNGSVDMKLNKEKLDVFMGETSTPVQETIVAYINGYHGELDPATNAPAKGSELYTYDNQGNPIIGEYNNYFLSTMILGGTGADAEAVSRLSIFGGTAQAAVVAGSSTYEAVNSRMGVGAQNGSITFADNGQGAGLWVTPIYKSHDSDGFNAQGVTYGADLDITGLTLGADYTLGNGVRVGAAFNVGSGDADGQGAGAGVSNDFDYYGFSVYGGYTMGAMSVVADLSYTAVDNDVTANTAVEKVGATIDSSNMSLGVTGQYALDLGGMSVTPHAGLRFTQIDMDDYTVKGSGDIAHYSADSASIFSIPVGVTFAKDIVTGSWIVKPALDLTLTANVGDDSVDGTVDWSGVENLQTKVESEIIDNFTYGATLGVAAKSGNLSIGFGVNYTGASNADEYGVNANARFVF